MAILKKLALLTLVTSLYSTIANGMETDTAAQTKVETLRQITALRAEIDKLLEKLETETDLGKRHTIRKDKSVAEIEIYRLTKLIEEPEGLLDTNKK